MIFTFLAVHSYYKMNFNDSYLVIYFLADSQKSNKHSYKQIFDAFIVSYIYKKENEKKILSMPMAK
jgi:hypothetical protein